jgi:hypothetical protein
MVKAKEIQLTQTKLQELFDYKEGNLYWKVKSGYGISLTKPAGNVHNDGYIRIKFKGQEYKAHRLIWIYINGSINDRLFVDHINGNKLDNNIQNLRLSTNRANQSNQYRHRAGKLVGTCLERCSQKWVAEIGINCKNIKIGRYSTELEAHAAYLTVRKEWLGY